MKDKALLSTLVVLLLAMVALLTAYAASRESGRVPSRAIVEQSVVTAPPLGTVMGGPPATGHAAR